MCLEDRSVTHSVGNNVLKMEKLGVADSSYGIMHIYGFFHRKTPKSVICEHNGKMK